jgi:hypothetical protein
MALNPNPSVSILTRTVPARPRTEMPHRPPSRSWLSALIGVAAAATVVSALVVFAWPSPGTPGSGSATGGRAALPVNVAAASDASKTAAAALAGEFYVLDAEMGAASSQH